eukprot:2409421-Pyramimonas_sp.AAC.1
MPTCRQHLAVREVTHIQLAIAPSEAPEEDAPSGARRAQINSETHRAARSRQQRRRAARAGRRPQKLFMNKPSNIQGVGNGAQERAHQASAPIALA